MSKTSKVATIAVGVLIIGPALLVWQGLTGFSATLNIFERIAERPDDYTSCGRVNSANGSEEAWPFSLPETRTARRHH